MDSMLVVQLWHLMECYVLRGGNLSTNISGERIVANKAHQTKSSNILKRKSKVNRREIDGNLRTSNRMRIYTSL